MFKHTPLHILCMLAFASISHATQAASSWQINPEGTGQAGATSLTTLNVGGVGFVQIQPDASNPTQYSFVENGAYRAVQADGVTPFGSHDLTITYSVIGTGSFLSPGALQFTSGKIDIYSDANFDFASTTGTYGADNGKAVARFNITGGNVDSTGLVKLNASVASGSMQSGYFFGANGNDLAGSHVQMNLGVYNQPLPNPDNVVVSEIVCGMSAYPGSGCNGTPYVNTFLASTVRDGGFVSLSPVPEPTLAAMMSAGLGILTFVSRRRKTIQSATA